LSKNYGNNNFSLKSAILENFVLAATGIDEPEKIKMRLKAIKNLECLFDLNGIEDFDHLIEKIYEMMKKQVDHRTRRKDNINIIVKRNKTKKVEEEVKVVKVEVEMSNRGRQFTNSELIIQKPNQFIIENEKIIREYSYNENNDGFLDDVLGVRNDPKKNLILK
jgi:hypothetical protein